MESAILPERLKSVRESRNLNKAEAARLLGLSKMGYLRYETGDRAPAYQTIVFMAQKLGTSPEYLIGLTDDPAPQELVISQSSDPELYALAKDIADQNSELHKRLLAYYQRIKK